MEGRRAITCGDITLHFKNKKIITKYMTPSIIDIRDLRVLSLKTLALLNLFKRIANTQQAQHKTLSCTNHVNKILFVAHIKIILLSPSR